MLIGDLGNYFLDKTKPKVTYRRYLSFLLFFGGMGALALFGAWAGLSLGSYLSGSFPSVTFAKAVVAEFTGLTAILVLIDVLVKYKTFKPRLEFEN